MLGSSFLRNVAGTFLRQFASGLLNLFTVVLVARILGPGGSGSYAVALLLPTLLATFLNLGVSSANVYYLASRGVDLRTSSTVTFYLWAVCCIFGLIIGAAMVIYFGEALFPEIGREILLLSLASFPFILLLQAAGGILQGVQDFHSFNLTLLAPPLVSLLSAIALALFSGLDLYSLMLCNLLGQVVGVVAGAYALLRRPEWGKTSIPGRGRQYLSKVLSYGLKAYASNVVTFFNYRADLFLVNFFLGPSSAGIYVVAMQFAEKLWLLSQAVSTVFLPRVSELSGDEQERKRFTPLVSRWTLLLTLVAALSLGLIFNALVHILMGEEYSDATWVLWILLPGIVAWAPARVLANDIAGRGCPEINLFIACVVVAFNLIGNVILISLWGLAGAAISTSLAYLLMLVMTVRSYILLSHVPPFQSLIVNRGDVVLVKSIFQSIKNNKKF